MIKNKDWKVAPLKELSAFRLSILIDEVLKNPTYRDSARYLQKKIAEANGLSVAADLLERSFGLTKKTCESSNNKRPAEPAEPA